MQFLRTWHELDLLWTEAVFIGVAVAICLLADRKTQILSSFAARFRAFARQPRTAILSVFLFTLLMRVAVWPVRPVQAPYFHDEFSYLLLGDTLAHGRLANPTHAMWTHFESFHIIQHPVYASVYPFMQGVFLAGGQVLAGAPWVGVWISVALMCAAIYWMLQGWLPPGWALAGALLAAVRLGVFSYWMNSYWGGAVACLGAALVMGSLPRILRHPKTSYGIVLAAGIVILANSRPYEGFVLCAAVVPVLAAWLFGWNSFLHRVGLRPQSASARSRVVKVLVPTLIVLILGGAFTAYYYRSITGSPLKAPYAVEREQYGVAQAFVWQKDRSPAPEYNIPIMATFYEHYETIRATVWEKIRLYWMFYLGPVLTIPLLLLPRVISDRRTRFPLVIFALGIPAVGIVRWANPHYFAPFVPALCCVLLQGTRHLTISLRRYRGSAPRRAALAFALPIVIVAMIAVPLVAPALGLTTPLWPLTWASTMPARNARAQITHELEGIRGRHLVIVQYLPGHNIHEEFVYNGADIDNSKIVWARSIDDQSDQELIRYFKGRTVWRMKASQNITVVPDAATTPDSTAPGMKTEGR